MLARAARQLVWRYLSCVRERECMGEVRVGGNGGRGEDERRVGEESGR